MISIAIVESGSFYDVPCNWNISAIREANYQSFLVDTGCTDLACLKTLDNSLLYNISLTYYATFLPSIDGDFMRAHAVELFATGNFTQIPLLIGVNNDEGNILVPSGSNNASDIQTNLISLNSTSYTIKPQKTTFEKLFQIYPDDPAAGVPMNTGSGLLASGVLDKTSFLIFGDAIEHSVRRWLSSLFSTSNVPVFSYRFARVPWRALMSSGATHGTEITYVFGNTNPEIESPLGPRNEDLRLSRFMSGAWVGFVHHLDPSPLVNVSDSGDLVFGLPDYRVAGQNMVFAGDASHVEVDEYRSEGLAFWTEQRIVGCTGLRAGA